MKRIGLTQRVEVNAATGERRDALDQRWVQFITKLGWLPLPLGNCPADAQAYLAALRLDGLLLTGGNDLAHLPDAVNAAPERDAFERAVLDFVLRENLPVLGICRGLQFLNVFFGGRLVQVMGHAGSRHSVTVEPGAAHRFPFEAACFEVNSYHHYGFTAESISPAFEILAMAEDGVVEAVAHKTYPITGMMWHPERETPCRGSDIALMRHVFGEAARV